MKINTRLTLVLAVSLMASACQQQAEPESAPVEPTQPVATAPEAAPAPAVPATAQASAITFEPAAISECAVDQKAMVRWDVTGAPDVTLVRVYMVLADGKESLFATSTPKSEKETGPWARGGLEVVVRDDATDAELARTKVPGLPCP